MPRLKKTGERGDLLAEVSVVLPTDLTSEERDLFEQLRARHA
jgi:DnaJ-class molecular chaperone